MKSLLRLCVLVLLLGTAQPGIAAPSLVDHYRKALKADPQNHNLRYHLGIALLNQGEDADALEAFRRAYPYRSGDPEINFNLALVYTRLGDPDSALIYLDQAQANGAGQFPEIYPLQNAYFNLALLYGEKEQFAEAVHLLRRLSQENPEHLGYLRLLGDFELRSGHIDAAVDALSRYLDQAPEDTDIREYAFAVLYNRGMTALEQGRADVARGEFSRALQFEANSPLIFYNLALLDYREEKYSQVADRLPQIFPQLDGELQESARAILYNTALALKRAGSFPEALQALTPLTSAVRPRSKDMSLLAGTLFSMKKYDQARDAYLRVLQLDPGNGMAANGVQAAEKGAFTTILDDAGAAFAANDLPAVRGYLAKAAEIYPEDNRLRIYQARLARLSKEGWQASRREAEKLEEAKQYSEALDVLRQGLRLAPAEPELLRYEQRLVKLLSGRIENLYRQGKDAYDKGHPYQAKRIFLQLVELSPSHKGGAEYLRRIDQSLEQTAYRATGAGEAALAQGELIAARDYFAQALKAWPEFVAAREGLQQAEQLLEARIAETLLQARRERIEGRLTAARELLAASLEKWPSEALETELARVDKRLAARRSSVVQLVREAIAQEEFSQAEQLLSQASRIEAGAPDVAGLRTQLEAARRKSVDKRLVEARTAVAAGHFETGLKAYRSVLDLSPENAEALAGLRRGRAELEQTLAQLLAEGAAAHHAGKLEQARKAYRDVLGLDPHHEEALAALRKIERAGRAGLTAQDSQRLYLEGIELYTEGDYSQAIAVWRQVLDLDPNNEKAQMNIDKARRKLKQIQERKSG